MGKKSPKIKASPAEQAQARISQELHEQFGPLRQALLGAGTGAATQAFSTDILPAEREMLESQFGQSRENILQATPARGGQLNALLAGNEMERAGALIGAQGQAFQRGTTNALNVLGPGAIPEAHQVLGSLGQAAQMGANRSQLLAKMAAQQSATLGQGIGDLAGLFLGGRRPWIFGG